MLICEPILLISVLWVSRPVGAVRGCTVIAIQPDLRWKKAVCDSDTSQLTIIPQDLPDTLISLRVTQQSIHHLADGVLHELIFLEELHIDSCGLRTVDPNVFKGLNRLRILSLRNNSLKLDDNALQSNAFHHLTALEVLDISENPLGRIPSDFFIPSLGKTLLELRVGHTKGDVQLDFDVQTFQTLINLKILDLSFTGLESLHSEFRSVLAKMEKLRELQLGGNPWHCDCTLRWMREWYLSDTLPSMQLSYIQQTSFGTISTISAACKSPYPVQGRLIFIPPGRGAIEPDEFICKQWIDTKRTLVGAVVGGNLSLTCHGYTEVVRDVQWLKDGLPLVLPSPRFKKSQTSSLDFTAFLNISQVNIEDAGTWECRLDGGKGGKMAQMKVTVTQIARGASKMDSTERQNLVYAGIGLAALFILLAATAMAVFFCGGCRGAGKQFSINAWRQRLLKNTSYSADLSNTGDDARELIGTRVANCRRNSPMQLRNQSLTLNDKLPIKDGNSVCIDRPPICSELTPPAGNADALAITVAPSRLVSLTTTTITTTALTQPALSTIYKPQPPNSTVLITAGYSSPSNPSINANYADLYRLPISAGYGAVKLPSHLLAEIAGNAVTPMNNHFLVSSACPLHGSCDNPPPPPHHSTAKMASISPPFPIGCPIHGSPTSTLSQSGLKHMTSSFTQTPRKRKMSKSTVSLNHTGNYDSSSYHQASLPRRRYADSSGSCRSYSCSQTRYRTLPSRINQKNLTACPIHGQLMPSLLRRRSSSVLLERKSRPSSRSPGITVDVPYCSSCASSSSSSSSESVNEIEADIEEYSSDATESPRGDSSDSGSSDYVVQQRPLLRSNISQHSLSRVVNNNSKRMANDGSSSSTSHNCPKLLEQGMPNAENWARRNVNVANSIHQSSRLPGAIMGQPVVLSIGDSRGSMLASRSFPNYGNVKEKANPTVIPNHNHQQARHSSIKDPNASPSSTPKSILVKTAFHRHQCRRANEKRDDRSTSQLL